MSGSLITARFGATVRGLRFRLGLSQEELAERADLHRTYIAGIERGARNVTLKSIDKLAKALGTNMASLIADVDLKANRRASSGGGAATDAPVDILYVEDDPADAELTLHALKTAGLGNTMHIVHDGAEALEFIFGTEKYAGRNVENRPRLILLDLYLPKVGGMEVLRRLKADKGARSIPVVVLTGSREDRDIAEARQLGADGYVVKPIDFRALSEVIPKLNLCWLLFPKAGVASRVKHG